MYIMKISKVSKLFTFFNNIKVKNLNIKMKVSSFKDINNENEYRY